MRLFLLFLSLGLPCIADEYFPKNCFSVSEFSQKFKADWYSSQLRALQESPLYSTEIDPKIECYRFTWLRTFHRPVAFRIDVNPDGTGQFTIKVADGAGGFEPGKLVRDEKKPLEKRLMEVIRWRFSTAKFFELPPFEENQRGNDGSEWILEAVRDGKYHIVTRWTPQTGPIQMLGMEFIEIGIGGDFTPIY